MTLAFITCLRHPANSTSYAEVERLLEATLHSVAQQTTDDFVSIVVGHRPPPFELPRSTYFVPVDFDPPPAVNGPHAAIETFVWDKGTKIGIGLLAAREHRPDRVMVYDADDFVSSRLAAFSNDRPGPFGWLITDGLIYSGRRGVSRRTDRLNRICGTSAIVPWEAFAVPDDLGLDATQDEVGAAFGERLRRIMGAHREAGEWLVEHGFAMSPLPFPGAVYHVETGENHAGFTLLGVTRPATRAVRAEFGIPAAGPFHRSARHAYAPAAVRHSLLTTARRVRSARRGVGAST